MNNFLIIWESVSCSVIGRTKQHLNHKQTMVFRINTRTEWNLIHQFPRFNAVSIVTTCPTHWPNSGRRVWIHPVFQQTLISDCTKVNQTLVRFGVLVPSNRHCVNFKKMQQGNERTRGRKQEGEKMRWGENDLPDAGGEDEMATTHDLSSCRL